MHNRMKRGNFKNVKFFLSLLVLIASATPAFSQTTYTISDPHQLEEQTYVAGDIIILTNGTYDSDERIDFVGNGTPDNPIIFRAENPGGVKFTGGLQLNIGGDHVVVDGFYWKGGFGASNFIQFRNGTDYANFSTIQNCVIDGLAIHPDDVADDLANNSITKHRWIVLYGTYNSVINCTFMNKESAGALVLAEYQYNAEDDPCQIVGHTISNNYFYKYKKIDNSLSNSGDSETIRLGASSYQNVNSNVLLSNNYFVEADGENEIITNKSKGNTFINNTFRRCRGSLVLRHGSNATVDRNYFLGENVEGTGGVRISDSDHTITNNYIQDCINKESQAKWNNGVTFLGGNDNASVECAASGVTNGYQKSENINFSNNTIVNTYAPLFFNTSKGSADPQGSVSDNLIYYSTNNPNTSNVILGDTPTAYEDLGAGLTYSGNIYAGTELGASSGGFSLESGLTASNDEEIFTFTNSSDKGANMGDYRPVTDDLVGYGIGACFLDYLGENINDGLCDVEVGQYLTIGSLPVFPSVATTNEVIVNSNVDWTVSTDDVWISLDTETGSGNGSVQVLVNDNSDTEPRVGTVIFAQSPGGEDITRTLTITQEGAELTSLYKLINTGTGLPTDKVTLHSFSKEEVNGDDKFNYASNTLDKNSETVWAADDDEVLAGDYKGDGEYIIYDLGRSYGLELIQFSTTNKSDAFGFQVWVSTTGTDESDFSMILPTSGDLIFTATNSTDFNQYEIDQIDARYVKLIGFGRFNETRDTRESVWSAVREIEFYEGRTVSISQSKPNMEAIAFPVPASNSVTIQNLQGVKSLSVFALDGRLIKEKSLTEKEQTTSIDVSSIPKGMYFVILSGSKDYQLIRLSIVR